MKREPAIVEIVIDPESLHRKEHNFLTMSIVGQNETKFPMRHNDSHKEIKSTTESESEIYGPIAPKENVGFSPEHTTILDLMTTPTQFDFAVVVSSTSIVASPRDRGAK